MREAVAIVGWATVDRGAVTVCGGAATVDEGAANAVDSVSTMDGGLAIATGRFFDQGWRSYKQRFPCCNPPTAELRWASSVGTAAVAVGRQSCRLELR